MMKVKKRVKAATNEAIFKKYFESKFGNKALSGKKTFKAVSAKVQISVDESIIGKGKSIFVEVDSYNMAKVIVGQYVLLNEISDISKNKIIFVTVHFYKGYNPERTTNNLNLLNRNLYNNNSIPHCSFTFESFKLLCESCTSINDLIKSLAEAATRVEDQQ